jgi:predicted nuclease of predicted toxin-antitoxin system
MATHLRLLVDECIEDDVLEWVKGYDRFKVVDLIECGLEGADDATVVQRATDEDRILLTQDKGVCEREYPICSHSGIIILVNPNPNTYERVVELLQGFFQSGRRQSSKHAIVRLKNHAFEVTDSDGLNEYSYH